MKDIYDEGRKWPVMRGNMRDELTLEEAMKYSKGHIQVVVSPDLLRSLIDGIKQLENKTMEIRDSEIVMSTSNTTNEYLSSSMPAWATASPNVLHQLYGCEIVSPGRTEAHRRFENAVKAFNNTPSYKY